MLRHHTTKDEHEFGPQTLLAETTLHSNSDLIPPTYNTAFRLPVKHQPAGLALSSLIFQFFVKTLRASCMWQIKQAFVGFSAYNLNFIHLTLIFPCPYCLL